jgi:hypothetical protein
MYGRQICLTKHRSKRSSPVLPNARETVEGQGERRKMRGGDSKDIVIDRRRSLEEMPIER